MIELVLSQGGMFSRRGHRGPFGVLEMMGYMLVVT